MANNKGKLIKDKAVSGLRYEKTIRSGERIACNQIIQERLEFAPARGTFKLFRPLWSTDDGFAGGFFRLFRRFGVVFGGNVREVGAR